MVKYIIKRLLLIIPTLFGIMLLNFIIMQAAPGGPMEQIIAQIQGFKSNKLTRLRGESSENGGPVSFDQKGTTKYRGAQGLDPEYIKKLEKIYGFDKPAIERFFIMLWRYIRFDFDKSFYSDKTVLQLIFSKLPVSVSLGLWTTLLVYMVSIPLGIKKAVKHKTPFDIWTSGAIIIGYAIPAFLFAILLLIVFSAGNPFKIFPLRGIVSDNWDAFPLLEKIGDYIWHMVLPVFAMVIGGFTSLTILTKNFFLEEIRKQYVVTARAKGLTEKRILYGHVFRNAMLLVIAGFPAAFLSIIFTGSLLIEIIFSLDGIGLLGYTAILKRDYPLIFGSLYFFSFIGLFMNLINDLMYRLIDPRIDFESREV